MWFLYICTDLTMVQPKLPDYLGVLLLVITITTLISPSAGQSHYDRKSFNAGRGDPGPCRI